MGRLFWIDVNASPAANFLSYTAVCQSADIYIYVDLVSEFNTEKMSSDEDDYERETQKFRCSHVITVIPFAARRATICISCACRSQEEHKQAIYGISICPQALPDDGDAAFLFATCAVNQVSRAVDLDVASNRVLLDLYIQIYDGREEFICSTN